MPADNHVAVQAFCYNLVDADAQVNILVSHSRTTSEDDVMPFSMPSKKLVKKKGKDKDKKKTANKSPNKAADSNSIKTLSKGPQRASSIGSQKSSNISTKGPSNTLPANKTIKSPS